MALTPNLTDDTYGLPPEAGHLIAKLRQLDPVLRATLLAGLTAAGNSIKLVPTATTHHGTTEAPNAEQHPLHQHRAA